MRRLISQMIWRPVAALVSSMGLIGQRLPDRQLVDGLVGRFVYAFTRPSVTRGEDVHVPAPGVRHEPAESAVADAIFVGGFGEIDSRRVVPLSYHDSEQPALQSGLGPRVEIRTRTGVSKEDEEEVEMDRDLRDDMLKLVRYKVLFVKREYEHAFREQEDLVSENMDGAAFTAWKVAEFIQGLANNKTEAPAKWGKTYPEGYRKGDILTGLPDEDKKYLRVYYEVMDRYPREKFKYEEEQISVLEGIRDEIEKMHKRPAEQT